MSRDTRRDGKHVKNHVWTGTGTADRLISEQRQINSAQHSSVHFMSGSGVPFVVGMQGARGRGVEMCGC